MSTKLEQATQPAEGLQKPRVPSQENNDGASPGTPSAAEIAPAGNLTEGDSGAVYPGVDQNMGTQRVRDEEELESDDPDKPIPNQ